MKKVVLTLLAGIFAIVAANAQISAGGGLSYGTDMEKLGITVKGDYSITEQIDASAGLTYFFPEKETISNSLGDDYEFTSNYMTLNVNGLYNYEVNESITAYGLGGLNVGLASVKTDAEGAENTSDTHIGVNLGIGGKYALSDALGAFVQTKYVVGGDGSQPVLTFGVLFSL